MPYHICTLNSEKSCGTDVGLAMVLDCVTASVPDWAVVFLPEFDGYTRDILPPESNHIVHRHYPGEGSFSMAWVVNRDLQSHIKDFSWHGRSGGILLEPGANYVVVVGSPGTVYTNYGGNGGGDGGGYSGIFSLSESAGNELF